jgi:cytochrome c-type biogenesis protein CcmF
MFIELGHFALALALFLALIQSVVPLVGAARRLSGWMSVGRTAAIGQFAMVAVSFAALTHAYVTSDFSVSNVLENSHSAKPMLYKISGVWGNHEGSMLLWILILSLCGAAVAVFGDNLPRELRARVLAVQGMVAAGFLLFILATSNPFTRVIPAPMDGHGLNPVLQDPGLAFHPPFLYLGYVGSSVAFAFAVAALIEGRVDAAWARWVRPWALVSWCALTVGIALGSWWAYYTLGWGGWWFWDPVENASLLPWLSGTALIHSAIVVERRDTMKSWTILLALLTFGLALVGTFLVRSGVLSSVHAFAVDPARGVFILGLLVLAIGGSLTLYALRAPAMQGGGLFAPISREGALVLNNLLLATATGTVLLGTLYPLFMDAFGLKISVGPPFYNRTFLPLMTPLLVAMAIGPLLAWKRGDLVAALQRLWVAFGLALLVVLVGLWLSGFRAVLAILGLGLAAWIAAGVLAEWGERVRLFRVPLRDSWRRAAGLPRAAYGMSLAHFGIGVMVAGISASAFEQERIEALRAGDRIEIAGYTMILREVRRVPGPNYIADEAVVEVMRGGAVIDTMRPQRRLFTVQRQTTAVTAIRTGLSADLYLALGEGDAEAGWVIRAWHKPIVSWIWLGALVMALGGVVSLTDRRWRVGVAARKPAGPAGAQPAAAE